MSWTLGVSKVWAIGAVSINPAATVTATTTLTIDPLNIDDLFGLDSNKPETDGPNIFPIGIRVTNTGGSAATNVFATASFILTLNSNVSYLGPSTLFVSSLAIGASHDFYFQVQFVRLKSVIGQKFTYAVGVQADNACAISLSGLHTETIQSLVSQNRNAVTLTGCSGNINVGDIFQCTLTGSTSSNNFNALRTWPGIPGDKFNILQTHLTLTAGSEWKTNSPDCLISGGCGGSFTETLTLVAIAAGSNISIPPFEMDTSGGSYHWNGGAATTINVNTPTAIRLRGFGAARSGSNVELAWKTGYEVSNLGYRIYRDDGSGSRTLITPGLVAGSALSVGEHVELSSGRSYRWFDRDAPEGSTYVLEDIDLNGSTELHGPVVPNEAEPGSPKSGRGHVVAEVRRSSPTLADVALAAAGNTVPSLAGFQPLATTRKVALATNSAAQNRQFSIAGLSGVKALIKQEGWYRLSHQDLINAGWDPGTSPTYLQLYVEGQPIPMLVNDLGGGNYTMEFYGTGLDMAWTDTRVYWITLSGTPGTRLTNEGGGSGSAAPSGFPFTVGRRDRTLYISTFTNNGDAENWFGAPVGPPGFPAANESVTVSNLDTANNGSASLKLALQGFTSGGITHNVDVRVNGNLAGTVSFPDQTYFVTTLSVPVSWLSNGTNSILLSAEGSDYSLVSSASLTYPHLYTAEQDALVFSVTGGKQVTISGFTISGIRIFDITNPSAVRTVSNTVDPDGNGGFAVTLTTPSVAGSLRFLAIADDRISSPSALISNAPSAFNKKNNAADLVMISHPSLLDALAPLQALRQSQGLATQIVDITDVYDEFNFGEKSPYAIKSFLQWTTANWKKAPRYAILVGDASTDPRNYLGWGDFDLLPTKLVPTVFLKTASDDWFVDFNNDTLPELPIGRIPARTLAEANTVVSKIVGYDSKALSSGVYLIADTNDENDFRGAVGGLVPLVGNGKVPQTLCVGSSAESIGSTPCVDAGTAGSQILATFNSGPALINYVGHGSETIWSKSDLFNSSEISSLTNAGQLPVVLAMNCLNGTFQDVFEETLAETLLKAPNGGAAAVWASSSLTLFESQVPVNQTLFQHLFASPAPRIGDAMVAAKSATSDPDVRRTWILFGDPTMILR
jgi:hypothetical protein